MRIKFRVIKDRILIEAAFFSLEHISTSFKWDWVYFTYYSGVQKKDPCAKKDTMWKKWPMWKKWHHVQKNDP